MTEPTSPDPASLDPRGDTRSRILAAAMSLFSEQGYAGTSVRDISERLGVTKAALYYHFPSKESILDALLEPFVSELGRLVDLVRQSPPPPPRIIIERFVEALAGPGGVLLVFADDPSVIHRKIGKSDILSLQQALVHGLAGPAPTHLGLLRAYCAVGSLRGGIIGMAIERAQAAARQSTSADEERRSGAGEAVTCSERIRVLVSQVSRTFTPLVSAAEQGEIVAAALAALGDDPADSVSVSAAGSGGCGAVGDEGHESDRSPSGADLTGSRDAPVADAGPVETSCPAHEERPACREAAAPHRSPAPDLASVRLH
ncbi:MULTISPECIES: TetR/AcrR family transcriptional regulator [Frankia]|nr:MULTISPECIES: TetR/AcrR family transcriptional regulator [Frankia]